jgi:hypothetical protein
MESPEESKSGQDRFEVRPQNWSPQVGLQKRSLRLENRERTVRGLGSGRVLRDRERG